MSTTSTGALYAIVRWVEAEGEVKALDRMLVFCLSALFRERITDLITVDPELVVSEQCLAVVRDAATRVVGKPCPY